MTTKMAISETSKSTGYRLFSTLAILAVIIYAASFFIDIIILLVISVFITMMFHPLVNVLESRGINRLISIMIVFSISGVVIFFGLSVLIPKIATQMNTLAQSLNQEKISILLQQVEEELRDYIPFIKSDEFAVKLEQFISELFFSSIQNLSDIVSSIVSVIAISVIVPFMTFFMLKDNRKIQNGIINIVPNKYFEFSYYVINQIGYQLGRFVRGWIFDAFMVGFLAAVGLTVLGIKNSITIGFVAGVGHLIPYFGPVIGGLPAVIISLIQFGSFALLPEIVLLFVMIYTFDNGYLQPKIFSKSTDMHPLMIIILILLGSQLLGVLGMLIAVPAATVIKTAAKEIYYGYKNYRIINT
ncbi:MAG: AI-2E family transporter [Melioribacteraceae bacterium]|nr:AI-2E family transporter [Melioribacteraceae bacterium]